jgi:phospholipase/carboxylesterase
LTRRREPAGEAQGVLVLFHGRGADEDDLFPLLDELDPQHRYLAATPRAPLQLPPAGFHWYVVQRVGYPDPRTFEIGYASATETLDSLVEEAGVPWERVVVGGFSQGCVMALAVGLGRGRPRPAAILGFSGFIPVVEGWEPDLDPPLPRVALGHGTYDPVISVEFGRSAADTLRAAGADVLWRESPMPHAIDPRFVREAAALLP